MENQKVRVSLEYLAPFIEEKLENGESIEIIVTGNSMFPLFTTERDTVTLIKPKKLKKRQIAFYLRDNGQYILHRIIKIKGDDIYCVGDNQTEIEGPLRKDQFKGIVTHYVRKGKKRRVNCLWHKIYSFIWCLSIKKRRGLMRLLFKITGRSR